MGNVDTVIEIATVGLVGGSVSLFVALQVHRVRASRRADAGWQVRPRPGPMGAASPWVDIVLVPLPVERCDSRWT